jgi:allantoicase
MLKIDKKEHIANFQVEFFDEFHGNFDGYTVVNATYTEVETEAKQNCGEYEWFEISEITKKKIK